MAMTAVMSGDRQRLDAGFDVFQSKQIRLKDFLGLSKSSLNITEGKGSEARGSMQLMRVTYWLEKAKTEMRGVGVDHRWSSRPSGTGQGTLSLGRQMRHERRVFLGARWIHVFQVWN
jgi:hypothetical protein